MSTPFTCPHCGQRQYLDAGGVRGALCAACGQPLADSPVAAQLPRRPREPVELTVWEGEARGAPPQRPGTVLAAGTIWIVFGGLILVNFTISVLVNTSLADPRQRQDLLGGLFCGGLLVALFGGAFIFVGVQSITGTAKDTLGNGIGSIIFAALIGMLALMVLAAAARDSRIFPFATVYAVINFVVAAALLTAGILALIGRDGYREWRRALQGFPGRYRR